MDKETHPIGPWDPQPYGLCTCESCVDYREEHPEGEGEFD